MGKKLLVLQDGTKGVGDMEGGADIPRWNEVSERLTPPLNFPHWSMQQQRTNYLRIILDNECGKPNLANL